MSLNSAFQIGRSALAASQLGLTVAGNNISNAATPGYSRQVTSFVPAADTQQGSVYLGRGVEVAAVRRQVDTALQQRLNSSISQDALARNDLELLSTVETSLGSLSGVNIGSQLSDFFNAWSDLANAPTDSARRSLAVQQGRTLSSYFQETRTRLSDQRAQLDLKLAATVTRANDIVSQIAVLNRQVVSSDRGSGAANTLRDQRDELVAELAQNLDVTAIEQENGTLDVLVGSTPIVLAGSSRGLKLLTTPSGAGTTVNVTTKDNNEVLDIASGKIGSLLRNRTTLVDDTLTRLDTLAAQLIFEVNKAHSTAYGTTPLTTTSGSLQVRSTDLALAFNDPLNQTFAALPYRPSNGSFQLRVTNQATGASQTVRINVDLDGLTSAGTPGFADDTSLNSLAAALSAAPNVTAVVNASGQLSVSAAAGFKLNFSDDSSGVLAALGVNAYFKGTSAADIGVRQELIQTPGLVGAGKLSAGQPVDNGSARSISGLRDSGLASLGGATLSAYWDDAVSSIATRTGAAKTASDSAGVVKENLDAQRASISGVNIDEEAINLITYQRQYQASAKFISTVDDITQTLLGLIR